ncbi:MAG: NlpC/P60 family protein [Candidatus Babeliales bacterium]
MSKIKNFFKLFLIFIFYQIINQANLFCELLKMVVIDSVADVRSRPKIAPDNLHAPALCNDIGGQETQVSFCDAILVEELSDNSEWVKVSVLGQKAWKNNQWVSYPGFILKSKLMQVSEFPKYNIVLRNLWAPLYSNISTESKILKNLQIGTRLEAQKIDDNWWAVFIDKNIVGYLQNTDIYELSNANLESEEILREKIVESAYLFLRSASLYVWGGKSPVNYIDINFNNQITGLDCSSLTNLCYLSCGLEIPRDAAPQYRAANKLENGRDLKKTDLIFFAQDNQGNRISHVLMYVGDNKVIECTGLGFSSVSEALANGFALSDLGVREIEIKNILKDITNVSQIESGKTLSKFGKIVFLGSYFAPENKSQKMRNIALGQNIDW